MSILGNPIVIGTVGGGKNVIEIIKYSSESEMPASANENTIGVITDVTISDYVISATQPTTPVEGLLWIVENTFSTNVVTILNNQKVFMYIIGARVYTNSAWTSINCYIYKNLVWKLCCTHIIEEGVIAPIVGSSLQTYNDSYNLSVDSSGGAVKITSSNVTYAIACRAFFQEMIDLSNFSKLVITFQSGKNWKILYSGTKGTSQGTAIVTLATTSGYFEQVIDLPSGAVGNNYIGFGHNASANNPIYIKNLYFM